MLTHSKIPKYAFIGTSSSGKTTLTYKTCGFLKEHGIRVDGILQQDRRLPFSPALLETHAEAQHWFMFNMITAESYMSLQRGLDCIVSDRSVVDFFAYAETQWPAQLGDLFQFITSWASTYRSLIYLPPLPYDDDGVRPPDDFRLKVDQTLQKLLPILPNVVHFDDRKEAMRFVAIDSKLSLFGEAEIYMTLTGSWAKGKEKVGSDFDFIMLDEHFDKIPEEVRATFREDDVAPVKAKHNDLGLVRIFHSEELNVGIQCQVNNEFLASRLASNDAEIAAARNGLH